MNVKNKKGKKTCSKATTYFYFWELPMLIFILIDSSYIPSSILFIYFVVLILWVFELYLCGNGCSPLVGLLLVEVRWTRGSPERGMTDNCEPCEWALGIQAGSAARATCAFKHGTNFLAWLFIILDRWEFFLPLDILSVQTWVLLLID